MIMWCGIIPNEDNWYLRLEGQRCEQMWPSTMSKTLSI